MQNYYDVLAKTLKNKKYFCMFYLALKQRCEKKRTSYYIFCLVATFGVYYSFGSKTNSSP